MPEDPLKIIILRGFIAIVFAIIIVVIFKPFLSISVGEMVCSSCGSLTSALLVVIMVFGSIGVVMYKLMKVFYGG